MAKVLDPFRLLVVSLAGWMNERQLQVIDYLREENRVLREQLGGRRVRFNDDQRRQLAVRAKGLGRKLPREVATIVTPETLLDSAPRHPPETHERRFLRMCNRPSCTMSPC